MRVWLDPEKLKAYGLTVSMCSTRFRIRISRCLGTIGRTSGTPRTSFFNSRSTTLGRLSDVAQFENIIVKSAAAFDHDH